MAVRVGDLDQRQMDRLRVELAEAIAEGFAYPAFFDFHKGQAVARPLDRAKHDEIEQFLASANFSGLERIDLTSLEVRRFLERLLLRYLEVNPHLQNPRLRRRLPQLRARVPRVVAELQRGLVAHMEGRAPAFGARRQRVTWAGITAGGKADREDEEHNTRVLEATLLRRDADVAASGPLPAQANPAARPPAPATPPPPPAYRAPAYDLPASGDLTVPVSAQLASPYDIGAQSSPFAALGSGAQSQVFGDEGISERDTGEMPIVPRFGGASAAAGLSTSGAHPRELPQDLYDLYGEYLRDMHPESEAPAQPSEPSLAATATPIAPSPTPFSPFSPGPNGGSAFAAPAAGPFSPARSASAPPSPLEQSYPRQAPVRESAPMGAPDPATAKSDKLIFWQLRYQLEAYVRRASRSYGVQSESGDPSGVIDALRRSGFVDEADLRIAEGILALTDRVTAGATATADDYRQALMLYLLYHRSHLNV